MTSVVSPARPSESLFGQERLAACVGTAALVSLIAFEAMAVAVAMPAVAAALDGFHAYALAFGSVMAASILGIVLAGQWCDGGHLVRSTVIGLASFAAGLLLAGVADRLGWFLAGRIAQGLGGGMLDVAIYVGMAQIVPASLHPRLFALISAAWLIPGLVGPFIAAMLVENVGWRSVFLLAGVAALPAGALLLPAFNRLPVLEAPSLATPLRPMRLQSALLAMAGNLTLLAAALPQPGWRDDAMFLLGLAAVLESSRQLLPIGTLRLARGLPAAIGLRGVLGAAFGTAEVFIPLYLTRETGWTLGQAGLALSVGAVMWGVGSGVQSRIVLERRRRHLLRVGFVSVSTGIFLVAVPLLIHVPVAPFFLGWALAGFGIGLVSPILSVLTLSLSRPADQGRDTAALHLSMALAASVALAVADAVFAVVAPAGRAGTGFLAVLAMAGGIAATGSLFTGRVVPPAACGPPH